MARRGDNIVTIQRTKVKVEGKMYLNCSMAISILFKERRQKSKARREDNISTIQRTEAKVEGKERRDNISTIQRTEAKVEGKMYLNCSMARRGDNISTIQRTEAKGEENGFLKCYLTTQKIRKGHAYSLREVIISLQSWV